MADARRLCPPPPDVSLDRLEARVRGVAPAPEEAALVEKSPGELTQLGDLAEPKQRFRSATPTSLEVCEATLLELHRAVAQAEGRGHLHVPK